MLMSWSMLQAGSLTHYTLISPDLNGSTPQAACPACRAAPGGTLPGYDSGRQLATGGPKCHSGKGTTHTLRQHRASGLPLATHAGPQQLGSHTACLAPQAQMREPQWGSGPLQQSNQGVQAQEPRLGDENWGSVHPQAMQARLIQQSSLHVGRQGQRAPVHLQQPIRGGRYCHVPYVSNNVAFGVEESTGDEPLPEDPAAAGLPQQSPPRRRKRVRAEGLASFSERPAVHARQWRVDQVRRSTQRCPCALDATCGRPFLVLLSVGRCTACQAASTVICRNCVHPLELGQRRC